MNFGIDLNGWTSGILIRKHHNMYNWRSTSLFFFCVSGINYGSSMKLEYLSVLVRVENEKLFLADDDDDSVRINPEKMHCRKK